jgi:cation transporter-like permease
MGGFTDYDIGRYFQTKPLNAIGYMPIGIYPFAIGLSYFIPLDLSFSIWFFFVFHKMTRVWGAMIGVSQMPGFPFLESQSFGGWLIIGLLAIWTSRKFLIQQIRNAFHSNEEDARMVRNAVVGFVLGGLFVAFFFLRAGVSILNIFSYFLLYFALALAITRVRAEVGPPSHDVPWHPDKTLVSFFGTRRLGPEALTVFSMFHAFNRSYRNHPMPVMLEGFKAAELRDMPSGKLAVPVMLVAIVATVSSAWAYYSQGYHYGAYAYGEQAQCFWTYEQLKVWVSVPHSPNMPEIIASLGAMAFTGFLMVMRRLFFWWQFHPAGYALSLSYWNTSWYWFSIFLSWLFKYILVRLGGLRIYRRAMPFFAGIVLGEFFVGSVWSLIGIALEHPMYRFLY